MKKGSPHHHSEKPPAHVNNSTDAAEQIARVDLLYYILTGKNRPRHKLPGERAFINAWRRLDRTPERGNLAEYNRRWWATFHAAQRPTREFIRILGGGR